MRGRTAVSVDDDFAAGQAGVAVRAADDEIAGRIDQPLGLVGHHAVGQDFQGVGLDDRGDIRRRQAVLVLVRHQDLEDAAGQAVFIQHRHLRLGVRFQAMLTTVARFGQAMQDVVRPLQRRRSQFGGFAGGVTEHDALVAGAFVLVAARVDTHGDVRRLGVQVAGIVRRLPVEALLRIADILDRAADLVFQAVDNVADLVVAGAAFTGQDDAIGRHHRFAGHTRLGIRPQEGIDHNVGNTVGDLVRMAFGNAFAGEDIG